MSTNIIDDIERATKWYMDEYGELVQAYDMNLIDILISDLIEDLEQQKDMKVTTRKQRDEVTRLYNFNKYKV